MKLIIELSENDYKALKEDGVQNHLALADTVIANSRPYEEKPQGDLISREDLKNELAKCGYDIADFGGLFFIIDNAPTVPPKYFPPCEDCNKKMEEIRQAYDKMKSMETTQGEWIDCSEDYGYAECPFCEHLTTCEGNIDELHYCWNCGAKLVKGRAG